MLRQHILRDRVLNAPLCVWPSTAAVRAPRDPSGGIAAHSLITLVFEYHNTLCNEMAIAPILILKGSKRAVREEAHDRDTRGSQQAQQRIAEG